MKWYISGYQEHNKPSQTLAPPGPGNRKCLLPRHRLRRGTDGQGGSTWAGLDEGHQRRGGKKDPARTTYL